MEDQDFDSDQELFPIPNLVGTEEPFDYDDPFSVSGVLRPVVEGDLEGVKQCIEMGKSPNINDNRGNTPLHVAVIKDSSEIVDYLLTLDEVYINSRNFDGETPLFLAVSGEKPHLVEKLINAKCNVNLINLAEITPLHRSVQNPGICFKLLQAGADLNPRDYSGETPLHEAVNYNMIETVCMLLYFNADANVECDNRITPFMKSIILELVEIQKILIEYVIDFNAYTGDDMTITALALTHECPLLQEIINRGADVNYYRNPLSNALLASLHVYNLEKFGIIWKYYKYNPLPYNLTHLEACRHYLDGAELFNYLQVIIESGNLKPVFEDLNFTALYNFLLGNRDKKWADIVSTLIYLYVSYGYTLNSELIHQLYTLYGYSELLQFLLHIDIEIKSEYFFDLSTILTHINLSVNDFKKSVTNVNLDKNLLKLFRFIFPDGPTQIPSLLELSRNACRDFLVRKFNIHQAKHYYFLVKRLCVNEIYKDILTFRKPIYVTDC